MFISILYMFRAAQCSSSGESIVSVQLLVYVTLFRWPSSMQVGKFLPDLHTRRSPTQSDLYQMSYWYNWFSWWWALWCWNHVENWNKRIEKNNCASSWLFTRILEACPTLIILCVRCIVFKLLTVAAFCLHLAKTQCGISYPNFHITIPGVTMRNLLIWGSKARFFN